MQTELSVLRSSRKSDVESTSKIEEKYYEKLLKDDNSDLVNENKKLVF